MIPAEKRKYDRVKKLHARDKSDMIAGNKASEILSDASQVLAGDDSQGLPAEDNSSNNQLDLPDDEVPAGTTFGSAIVFPGTTVATPSVYVTTITQVIPGQGQDGGNGITRYITETRTVFPEGEKTTTTSIPKSTPSLSNTLPMDSESSSSGGLSNGAKIGIGVAVPIVFILLGLGIFFFFRRKKQQRLANKEGGVGEVMITGGKHHDEDGSSGGVAGSPTVYHPNVAPPGGVPGADPVPMGAPVPRLRTQEDDDELMNRPVSPVHDDDLLTGEAGSSHSVTRSGTALGGSVRGRGSPSLDDDREMQWILEEERKAKERREQQGRLPTHA